MHKTSTVSSLLAGVSALALAPYAFAGALADAVTSNVDTAELMLIGGIVLGVSGIVLLVRSGKRTAN